MKKRIEKKLTLNKFTVSNLKNDTMSNVKGGVSVTCPPYDSKDIICNDTSKCNYDLTQPDPHTMCACLTRFDYC